MIHPTLATELDAEQLPVLFVTQYCTLVVNPASYTVYGYLMLACLMGGKGDLLLGRRSSYFSREQIAGWLTLDVRSQRPCGR
jgi:hypothetical protein